MSNVRTKLLSQPSMHPLQVEYEGETLYIHYPTLKQWGRVQRACASFDAEGNPVFDGAKFRAYTIIEALCTGSGAKVFEPSDVEAILEMNTASPLLGEIGKACMKVFEDVAPSADALEQAGKN